MGAQLTLIFCLQQKHVLNYNCEHIKNIGLAYAQTRDRERERHRVASMYKLLLSKKMLTTVTRSFDFAIISIHKDLMDALGNGHNFSFCIVNVSRISAKNIT